MVPASVKNLKELQPTFGSEKKYQEPLGDQSRKVKRPLGDISLRKKNPKTNEMTLTEGVK